MSIISLKNLESYITDVNICGMGKEVTVYDYGEQVIKIFHRERKSQLERISDEGLIKLMTLPLNYFNKPIDIIEEATQIVGFTEKKLLEEDINLDYIDYQGRKEDIILLSSNGFSIQDLYYNYAFNGKKLVFYDLTSYKYVTTQGEFLKQMFYKNNIKEMNIFLIGLTKFDAFRTKGTNDYPKIYLANEYRLAHCREAYIGNIEKVDSTSIHHK